MFGDTDSMHGPSTLEHVAKRKPPRKIPVHVHSYLAAEVSLYKVIPTLKLALRSVLRTFTGMTFRRPGV